MSHVVRARDILQAIWTESLSNFSVIMFIVGIYRTDVCSVPVYLLCACLFALFNSEYLYQLGHLSILSRFHITVTLPQLHPRIDWNLGMHKRCVFVQGGEGGSAVCSWKGIPSPAPKPHSPSSIGLAAFPSNPIRVAIKGTNNLPREADGVVTHRRFRRKDPILYLLLLCLIRGNA